MPGPAPHLRLVPIILLTACAGSDTYTRVESVRSPLLGPFESYTSPADVRRSLPAQLPWRLVTDSRLPPGDPRPAYDWLTVSLAGYADLDRTGELVLTFFNDRLASTTFYPDDPEGYMARLGISALRYDTGAEVRRPPFTLIRAATDYHGRRFVSWEDERLRRQADRWIMRFS